MQHFACITLGCCAQGMTPQLVGEGQGIQWKVSKALMPILGLWLTVLYDTGHLLPLVSEVQTTST